MIISLINGKSQKINTSNSSGQKITNDDHCQSRVVVLGHQLEKLNQLLKDDYLSGQEKGISVCIHTIFGSRIIMRVFQVVDRTMYLMDEEGSLGIFDFDNITNLEIWVD